MKPEVGMRYVIALLLPEETKCGLDAVNRALRLGGDRGMYTRADHFHLTLAFLDGEQSPVGLPELLEDFPSEAGELTLTGWGEGQSEAGKTYWRGVEPSSALLSAQEGLIEELKTAGFLPEERLPRKKITLVRGFKPKHGFDPACILSALPTQKVRAVRVALLKEERILGRLAYTELYGKEL